MTLEMGEADTRIVSVHPRIGNIDAQEWDACANPDPVQFNPFVAHAFLKALEDAGTVGQGSGWLPHHLTIDNGDGRIGAAMPLYAKTHSQGEYVFDHSWAEAFHRAGGNYYPKLQSAVPFTPVPGPRLLVRPGSGSDVREEILGYAAIALTKKIGASSIHLTFLPEHQWERLGHLGFLLRTDQQFHWQNRGYRIFSDFLAELSSHKRKTISRERQKALSGGIEIENISGSAITQAHWDAMFQFYMDTGSRKWGRPYLNRKFFYLLGAAMPERCLLIFAKRHGTYVAGALNLIGGDCLYGRYWGATEHHPCLHFEICYYQAIDYAIAHGLSRVEAGAQGEHKLARGYLPCLTYSAHWIANESFREAIARYLEVERREVSEAIEILTGHGPFKKPCVEEQD
jgi:hypothetical protein